MNRELEREFYEWHRILDGLLQELLTRALQESDKPAKLFFEDFAFSLENLAKRVRRNI